MSVKVEFLWVFIGFYMQESKIGCSAEDRMNIKVINMKVITINIFGFLINNETHN